MSNVELTYLYRDGGNYKKWGRVVFEDPDRLNIDSVERDLRHAFGVDGLFIAGQIRVPEVFFCARDEFSSDDHCYHELDGVRWTENKADDAHHRSIGEFIAEANQKAQRGWQVFDPYDSQGSYGSLLTLRMK
jgi:hypothetical protein